MWPAGNLRLGFGLGAGRVPDHLVGRPRGVVAGVHDEGDGKTRLELRQGPFADGQLGADTRTGWESSFTKLDTLLRASLAPDLGTRRP